MLNVCASDILCCNFLHEVTSLLTKFTTNYYYYNCFTTLCPGLSRWVSTRRINHSGFCWSRHDGVAVASAEPYASYLHFASEDNHASTSSVRFLRAGCPSWRTTNSIKALNRINRIFKMSGNGAVSHVRHFLGLYDIEVLYKERRKKLLITRG